MKKILFILFYLSMLMLHANNFDSGMKALKEKKFPLSVKYFTSACEESDALGCHNLGIAYEFGEGVEYNITKATSLFEKACEGNVSSSCGKLAYVYEHKSKEKVTIEKIKALYEVSCKGSFAEGCNNLAVLYYKGKGVTKSYKESLKLYEKSCALHYGRGCKNAALLYAQGKGTKKDYTKAKLLFSKSCAYKYNDGCSKYQSILNHFKEKGLPLSYVEQADIAISNQNEKESISLYKKAYQNKEFGAALGMATVYLHSTQVEQNMTKAQNYAKESCDEGIGMACSLATNIHTFLQLLKTSKNLLTLGESAKNFGFYTTAEKYLSKACDADTQEACIKLASIYEYGDEQKLKMALALYTKACDLKYAEACAALATIYTFGGMTLSIDLNKTNAYLKKACEYKDGKSCESLANTFKKSNQTKAIAYYTQACTFGKACDTLGDYYSQGIGVTKDTMHATDLYTRSCENNTSNGCKRLANALLRNNNPEQYFKQAQKFYKKSCDIAPRSITGNINYSCTLYPKIPTLIKLSTMDLNNRQNALLAEKLGFTVLAHNYYHKSCIEGDMSSCDKEADNYYFGMGMEKPEKEKAMLLYEHACENNASTACIMLGDRFKDVNLLKSYNFYQKACALKSKTGCFYYHQFKPDFALLNLKHDNAGTEAFYKKEYDKAIDFFEKSCKQGDLDACNNLGVLLMLVKEETKMPDISQKYFEKACEKKHTKACLNLGGILNDKKEYHLSAKYLDIACEKGNGPACIQLSSLYDSGKGVKQDNNMEVKLLTQACENGTVYACSGVACIYRHGVGIQKDYAKAISFHTKSCEMGNDSSCDTVQEIKHFLNRAYDEKSKAYALFLKGKYKESSLHYETSCEKGNLRSCNNLGLIYTLGKDNVDRNITKALTLYKKACAHKFHKGCYNLARLYPRYKEAFSNTFDKNKLLRDLCNAGELEGCKQAIEELPYNKNTKMHTQLYQKACDLKDAMSCIELGKSYAKTDINKALQFYKKACNLGETRACNPTQPFVLWLDIKER